MDCTLLGIKRFYFFIYLLLIFIRFCDTINRREFIYRICITFPLWEVKPIHELDEQKHSHYFRTWRTSKILRSIRNWYTSNGVNTNRKLKTSYLNEHRTVVNKLESMSHFNTGNVKQNMTWIYSMRVQFHTFSMGKTKLEKINRTKFCQNHTNAEEDISRCRIND